MKDIKEVLEEELMNTLKDLGHQANEAKDQIQFFLRSIEVELATAVSTGDEHSLRYLRAAVAARLGRVSLRLLYREREKILNVVMTAVRVFITMAATV